MGSKQKKIAYMTISSEVFHPGILDYILLAKKQCDTLICGVLTDEILEENGIKPAIKFPDRKRVLESIRFVDEVIPQNTWGPNKNLYEIRRKNPVATIFFLHGSKKEEIIGKNYLENLGVKLLRVENEETTSAKPSPKNFFENNFKKRKLLSEEKRLVQAWGGLTSLQSLECHTLRYLKFPRHFANSIKDKIYCEIRKGHHTVYFSKGDIARWYEEGKNLLDKKNQRKLLYKNDLQIQKVNSFFNENLKRDYSNLSNEQLFRIYNNLLFLIMENGAFFPYSREETTKVIREEILNDLKSFKDKEKVFELLTTPIEKDLFDKEREDMLFLLDDSERSQKSLDRYVLRNPWRFINLYSKERIFELLDDELNSTNKESLRSEIEKKELRRKKLFIEQRRLFKSVSHKTKNLSLFLQRIAVKRLENKKIWAGYETLFLPLFKEIASRMNLDLGLMLYTHSIDEIKNFLKTGVTLSKNELEGRRDFFSINISNRRVSYSLYPIYSEEDLSIRNDGDIIFGESGNLGRVVGRVRIITQDSLDYLLELKKTISPEDIYVTTMTHPVMVSILNSVRGIITDEGGTTSHASIISRELNLPCLVGTRNATTFFKDGDYIELDSYNKYARKITKKKYEEFVLKVGNGGDLNPKKDYLPISLEKRGKSKIPYVVQMREEILENSLGGKGYSLNRSSQIHEVPKYFIITRRIFDELINEFIGKEKSIPLDLSNQEKIRKILEDYSLFVDNYEFDKEFRKLLDKSLRRINSENLAVRSSASGEDSENASFAGQFKTILGVRRDKVYDAIKECLKSALTENVLYYISDRDINLKDFYMALVIQEYINPEKAGVFFTKHPSDKTKKGFWIDANFGVGESVVSGETKPDHYHFYNGAIKSYVSEKKNAYSYLNGERKLLEEVNGRVLNDEEIKRLVHLAYQLIDEYGKNVEFEWCILEDKIYLLQVRPITT